MLFAPGLCLRWINTPDPRRHPLCCFFAFFFFARRGATALHFAAFEGLFFCTRLLLESGASVSAANVQGATPLTWAAAHGGARCVGLLLSKGADCEAADHRGRTPLHHAGMSDQAEVRR